MGNVVTFPSTRSATGVQLSAYPQDDGSKLYCVEALYSDETWEIISSTKDREQGIELTKQEAHARGVRLLEISSFPGRAA